MKKEEQQIYDQRHRHPKTSTWQIFDHEVGPYRVILAGGIPAGVSADGIPLDVLREDVEDQLTLILAGEEWLKEKRHRKSPVYGDIVENLGEIRRYRDSDKEGFMTKLENKIRELYRDETIVIRPKRA